MLHARSAAKVLLKPAFKLAYCGERLVRTACAFEQDLFPFFVSFHFETNRPITFLFFRPPSFLSSPFHDTLFDNIPGRTRNDSYRASIRYFLRSIAGRLVDRLIYNLIVFVEDTFRFVRGNFRKLPPPPLNKGALLGKNWKKKKKERKNYWIENFIRARRMKSIRGCTDGDKLKPKNRSKLVSIQANDNG